MPLASAVLAWLRQPAALAAACYLVLASLWIFASDQLLGFVVGDPERLLRFGTAKGITYVVVTTVLLYLLLKSWGKRGEVQAAAVQPLGPRRLLVVFLGLAGLVPLAGFGLVQLQEPRVERDALEALRAIGDLKARQLQSWLDEWRADADALRTNTGFAQNVAKWRRTGDGVAKRQLLDVVESLEKVHRYRIELLDSAGRPLPMPGAAPEGSGYSLAAATLSALRAGSVQTTDLYLDRNGRVRYDLFVPLPAGEAAQDFAVAVMHAPVEAVLLPLVDSWPLPSSSGESLLARRAGNEILYLDGARQPDGLALVFRHSLAGEPQLAAAFAATGDASVLVADAVDHAGASVLEAIRPVQGTTWHLVTKIGRQEVMAPLLDLIRWITLLALLAVAGVAVVVTMLWREQQHGNRLELAAREAEKDKLLKLFYELPFMGMSMLAPSSKRFLSVNDRLCEILGYRREQLLERTWADLLEPETHADLAVGTQQLLASEIETFRIEGRFRRPDGKVGVAEIDMRAPRRPDGSVDTLVAVVQCITERRQAEERTRQAATVFESTRDGVVIADLEARLLAVNKAFSEITGYAEAEVLGQKASLLKSSRHGREFYRDLWATLLATGQWRGEIWNRRKDGELYPTLMTITTVRDEQKRPTHYVAVFTDISELRRSEEKAAHLAHFDPLTDLPNRALVQFHLTLALERARRHGERAAVLFIDLDGFKTVNDSLGHVVGDELLVEVARRLRERIRDEDTLGRFGGDEFLLALQPIAEPEDAAVVARDILATLATPFRLAGGNEIYIGASIGISLYPEDGASVTELLRDADTAMYRAKDQGRNRFAFYTADMNASALAQLDCAAALRHALERGEFFLHYQPKVDLRSGQITGAEALIRWRRENGALASPAEFIPLAEKIGLIVPIGNWVIDAACRQLRAWQDAGWTQLRLAVNVSARQFHSDALTADVAQALRRYGVPPGSLELELTESMLVDDPERTIAILTELKRIGVKIALDDFGTGYSSFAYLSRFPIDSLKIDQSFVRRIVSEPQAAVIAVSIIELAHRLRLKVVAEGVENEAQLGYLKQRSCDEMQGYFFSKPLAIEAFDGLISEGRALAPAGATVDGRVLLIVDDEPNVIAALCRSLRLEGYRILTANSGSAGLEILAKQPVQVILSDQRMPQMTGTDFLSRVKEVHPDTVRMVLSGYADIESITEAVNAGAIFKFLHKPWDDSLLREQVRDAFLYYEGVVKARAARESA